MEYAKAYSAALALLITFLVGEVWIDLPETVTGAIATLFVPVVVWAVPNRKSPPE
jgi:hypothetical protein